MRRIVSLTLMVLMITLSFSGCGDYRGLDEITIIKGMSIDYAEDGEEKYKISFEVLNSIDHEKMSMKSDILEATGKTINDAIGKVDQYMKKQLYFGNMGLIVVSEQVAAEEGLDPLLDTVLKDFLIRNTVYIIVSREEDAVSLFRNKEEESSVMSMIIADTIDEKAQTPYSPPSVPIYKIVNQLSLDVTNMVLPAFRIATFEGDEGEENKRIIYDGLAVFEQDRFVGFYEMAAITSHKFLTSNIDSGNYLFQYGTKEEIDASGDLAYLTLEISDSKLKKCVQFDEEKAMLQVNLNIEAHIVSLPPYIKKVTTPEMEQIELAAGKSLQQTLTQEIKRMQERQWDIFGFGLTAYQDNYRSWTRHQDDWFHLYQNAEVDVRCVFKINEAGLIRENRFSH